MRTSPDRLRFKVPHLKGVSFETAIIKRYRRWESSVEEAFMVIYLAGVFVRALKILRRRTGTAKLLLGIE